MKTFLQAVNTKITATTGDPAVHNSFYNAISGRYYFNHAPQDTLYPLCVSYLINVNHDWVFKTDLEDIIFQFSIYSSSPSSSEVSDIYEYLKSLFDDTTLSVTNYTFIKMIRDFQNLSWLDDVGIWRYVVQYNIQLSKGF